MFFHEVVCVWQGFVVGNRGASFGIGFNGLMWVITGVFAYCLYCWWKQKDDSFLWLITGAAVNLVDRLRFGFVRDYWKIPGVDIYNNVGDWLIFVGVVIILWKTLKKK